MPTVKELKKYCKENNIQLLPHWNKKMIEFEIYLRTGKKFEKTEDEIKKEEKKDENNFIRCLTHDLEYLTREEFIEMEGIEYVEEIEKKYGKYIRYNISSEY
jgi:hypothetical protein